MLSSHWRRNALFFYPLWRASGRMILSKSNRLSSVEPNF
jgi:hypothetical protein